VAGPRLPVPAARHPGGVRLQPVAGAGLAAARPHPALVRAGRPRTRQCAPRSSTRSSRGPAATGIALVLGTLASLAVQRFAFFGRDTIAFALVLPIALPGVITGIALQTTFKTMGLNFGLLTIVIGHATFCVVIAYNNVVARLRRLPRTPEEASADLGADSWFTFRRITLPGMGTALLSGALLSFALSFDEIIVTPLHGRGRHADDPHLDLRLNPAADRAARSSTSWRWSCSC